MTTTKDGAPFDAEKRAGDLAVNIEVAMGAWRLGIVATALREAFEAGAVKRLYADRVILDGMIENCNGLTREIGQARADLAAASLRAEQCFKDSLHNAGVALEQRERAEAAERERDAALQRAGTWHTNFERADKAASRAESDLRAARRWLGNFNVDRCMFGTLCDVASRLPPDDTTSARPCMWCAIRAFLASPGPGASTGSAPPPAKIHDVPKWAVSCGWCGSKMVGQDGHGCPQADAHGPAWDGAPPAVPAGPVTQAGAPQDAGKATVESITTAPERSASTATPAAASISTRSTDGEGPCPLCGEPGEGYECDCNYGDGAAHASPVTQVGECPPVCKGCAKRREYVEWSNRYLSVPCSRCGSQTFFELREAAPSLPVEPAATPGDPPRCTSCGGQGWFDALTGGSEHTTVDCKACDGTGHVRAAHRYPS